MKTKCYGCEYLLNVGWDKFCIKEGFKIETKIDTINYIDIKRTPKWCPLRKENYKMDNEFKTTVNALRLALKNFIAVNSQLYPNETTLEKESNIYHDIDCIVNEEIANNIE